MSSIAMNAGRLILLSGFPLNELSAGFIQKYKPPIKFLNNFKLGAIEELLAAF